MWGPIVGLAFNTNFRSLFAVVCPTISFTYLCPSLKGFKVLHFAFPHFGPQPCMPMLTKDWEIRIVLAACWDFVVAIGSERVGIYYAKNIVPSPRKMDRNLCMCG
jgi:hypothetical protein